MPRLPGGGAVEPSRFGWLPLLAGLAEMLSERLEVCYDRIWMNWYRDNHDE